MSASPGLRVYVDGQFAGLTTAEPAGLQVSPLSAGPHLVRVEGAGFQSRRFVVEIPAGADAELKVGKLEPRRRIRWKPPEEPVDMTAGSPPLVVDDTGTPGPGNWEFNLVFSGDVSTDSDTYVVPLIDINHGLGETVQVKYEVPYEFTRDVQATDAGGHQTEDAHGFGNSVVGVKYRFHDNDEKLLSLAIYPQVEFPTPGANTRDEGGVADAGTTWILPFLLTKDFASFSVTANLDLEKSTDDPHAHLFAGLGAGKRLTPKLALQGEVCWEDLDQADGGRVLLNVGAHLKLSEKHALVGALGHDLRAGDGRSHDYFRFGYQRLVGK